VAVLEEGAAALWVVGELSGVRADAWLTADAFELRIRDEAPLGDGATLLGGAAPEMLEVAGERVRVRARRRARGGRVGLAGH